MTPLLLVNGQCLRVARQTQLKVYSDWMSTTQWEPAGEEYL